VIEVVERRVVRAKENGELLVSARQSHLILRQYCKGLV
jgi:hypothetical protein